MGITCYFWPGGSEVKVAAPSASRVVTKLFKETPSLAAS